ncbi:MAG TPA: EAL domain-containing protein [Candidatus Dormibacteraeota bacterium]|nr:EAL domain-containing protein [Candidatus Dormibacteraeota bacterium]
MNVLARVLQQMTAATSAAEAGQVMVKLLAESMSLETVAYFEVDEARTHLRRVAGAGHHDAPAPEMSEWPIDRGPAGVVATTGKRVLVNDVRREPRHGPCFADTLAELTVPLIDDGVCVGLIDVQAREAGYFTPTAVEVVEMIAAQAVILRRADRARRQEASLKADLERRLREQELLQMSVADLLSSLEVPALLERLSRRAAEVADAAGAAVWVCDPDSGLDLAAATPWMRDHLRQTRLDSEQDFWAAIQRQRRPVRRSPGEPGVDPRVWWRDSGPALLAVPIPTPGRISGVLVVAAEDAGRCFGEAEERILAGLATAAAIGMGNARLYEEANVAAATDSLTGLPNRREFERMLSVPPRQRYSMLAIDIDRFKAINDEFGHEAGDAVLKVVGPALRSALRTWDLLSRTGGDEFAVLLPDTEAVEARAIADRLCQTMRGVAVPFGAARISVGCVSAEAGTDPRQVWSAADAALYRAKRLGRDRAEALGYHSGPALEATPARWERMVRTVLDEHAFKSLYQPIFTWHGDVVGLEALARPVGGDGGAGVEGLFATAQRMGLARDLDWLGRRAALEGARALPRTVPVFVNVGLTALLDPLHDVDQMMLLLEYCGWRPGEVVLEISEREAIRDLGRFCEVLAAYRGAGFVFAMDDVGEGHSTFEVLAAGTPEFVKVARGLTRSAHLAGPRAAITAAVAFAGSSGAVVIAEGIETAREARMMAELGVDLGQGFWLAPPRPAEALVAEAGER